MTSKVQNEHTSYENAANIYEFFDILETLYKRKGFSEQGIVRFCEELANPL